ncbi:MAG TPA: HAD hydrolase family protein [Salinivirgaceae bacterium]|nr:HAD hydrolase family protein [Salinivirgaceae bacterium]
MLNFKERLSFIKAFVFDVDGVFTDGSLLLLSNGQEARTMNIRDGYAVHYAVKQNFPIAIISGGDDEAVRMRFKKLGVADIFVPSADKCKDFITFTKKYNLNPDNVLYMGDDMPDYEVIQMAGIRTCPANADSEIKNLAHYISLYEGGKGCVRDVIEQALRAQGKWPVK